ncbi:Short chain dehydrogenase [Lachnellula hyalina]|uniref:Short chain dehydrogenase n=1 Tax=Lachnellula hyalina TaxID=1316788 RepID=A0A8H8TW58_9HELO|nr:Short chain dehydrogenase [Lachnellula hyalina]TVY22945.1 Short chain dehydrogenase [Lachnellula hyalina]
MPIFNVLSQPFRSLHLPSPGSFKGQTVIITGANTGLGLATAQHTLNLGATKVILGVRTISKGEEAKAKILAETTNPNASIKVWQVDLNSFASVKAFAARAAKLEKLDTAIMNAGLATGKWKLSPEGWETHLQVNVLSTVLLSLLLLPTLVRTGKSSSPGAGKLRPHLTIVGSDVHADASLPERKEPNVLAAMNDEARWEVSNRANPAERYAASKLLGMYGAFEVAKCVPMIGDEPAVVVDVVAPGFCKSELLSREQAPWMLVAVQSLTGRTVAEGAKTVVDAASRGVDAHGKYLDHQKFAKLGPLIASEEGQQTQVKVWREIFEVLKKSTPEISSIVAGNV